MIGSTRRLPIVGPHRIVLAVPTPSSGNRFMLLLDEQARDALWQRLIREIETYTATVAERPVAPRLERERLSALLAPFDFSRPVPPDEALGFAVKGLSEDQVHTSHPRYFGLFNPAPTTMGIAADALVAAFNPQIAAWSHSPFAAEVEAHLMRAFGARFGYPLRETDGVFASGGAEANHTALLTALVNAFPAFAEEGVRSLDRPPVLYVSGEAHHSFAKAARLSGLGTRAVSVVAVDTSLRMDPDALVARIAADRAEGRAPFMVAATAGTTSAGAIDPLDAIATIARREGLWLHVDAAWGGAAALLPELRPVLAGIEQADSITFDAHKWLSAPMGAGLYLTRHRDILERTFRVDAGYMPRDAAGLPVGDPFARSMQWSRRFIGLKVFLSLAVAGWEGYAEALRHMVSMGRALRDGLQISGWDVVNDTPLPLVCFVDARHPDGRSADRLQALAAQVVGSGRAWISTVRLGPETRPALRACITNHRTDLADVSALLAALDDARG
jgi:glutamate/tyrosine decarboxylase-like PLP-dependent enzyme